MPCCGSNNGASLLSELTDLVNQIGGGTSCNTRCLPPCYPCCFPYAEVVMTCTPPILAPTTPQPVRPLQLACPTTSTPIMTQEEREATRYDNFYNNYNIDWHNDSPRYKNNKRPECTPEKQRGQTVDGKSPCCEDENLNCCRCDEGCPTGFKPCTMKLRPPPGCHPCGVWCAEIQPCPPKPRKTKQFEVGAARNDGCKK